MIPKIKPILFIAIGFSVVGQIYSQDCDCWTCKYRNEQTQEMKDYFNRLQLSKLANMNIGHPLTGSNEFGRGTNATQVVFLDFDSGNDGNVNYTLERREQIQTQMATIYERFDVAFTLIEPAAGEYSTIVFNEGFPGGLAQDIDFRNLNRSDNAVVNLTGLSLNEDAAVPASAVIGAHELGHLMGLKHEDSFGPIGSGVSPGFDDNYQPNYPGPTNADESADHIITTPALGSSVNELLTPSWLSERSVAKLQIAETGILTLETKTVNDSIETAQPVELLDFTVPNTIQFGQNAGIGDFSVEIAVIEGSLTGNVDVVDFFSFVGKEGDLINIEAISSLPNRFDGNSIDSVLSVYDSNGDFISYYGAIAFNNDQIFGNESVIVDLLLPASGTFFVEVSADSNSDSGAYELFINRFNGAAKNNLLGDINCDGMIDLLDVAPFVQLVITNDFLDKADINQDGTVNLLDVSLFVALLAGG